MLIAQISDLHVALAPIAIGFDTLARAHEAVAALRVLDPAPDCVIITGDLTEHGLAEEYEALAAALSPLSMPVLAVPGNHDRRDAFRAAFANSIAYGGSDHLDFCVELAGVRIIGLDTLHEGFSHGVLSRDSLAFASHSLAYQPEMPTLIACHHPPARCGIPLFDAIKLSDGCEKLRSIIGPQTSVQRILCGHLHRAIVGTFAEKIVQIAPSVSHGLAIDGDAIRIQRESPAYLLHDVSEFGVVSQVRPVTKMAGV